MKKEYKLELSAYHTILGDKKINILVYAESDRPSLYIIDNYDVIFEGNSTQNKYGEFEIIYDTDVGVYNKTLRLLIMKGCVTKSQYDDSKFVLTEKAILNAL